MRWGQLSSITFTTLSHASSGNCLELLRFSSRHASFAAQCWRARPSAGRPPSAARVGAGDARCDHTGFGLDQNNGHDFDVAADTSN
jgi:hypothetical protein